VDGRPVVLPLDSVAHLGGHGRRHKLQLIRLPDVDGSGHPAHFLGHGTAGWRGAAQERLVVRVRHGVHLQEHREVIQPAEFIALAEVLARLAGLDPAAILKAGLGVDLPSQARHQKEWSTSLLVTCSRTTWPVGMVSLVTLVLPLGYLNDHAHWIPVTWMVCCGGGPFRT